MEKKKRVRQVLSRVWVLNCLDGKDIWVASEDGSNFYLKENQLFSGCKEAVEEAIKLHNQKISK